MRKKKKNSKIVMVDERKKKGKGYSKRKSETFSILFMFENIDYKVMRENEKDAFYEKYMHFLNTLPQDVQYQELILNYPTDREMIEEAIVPKNDNQLCSRAVRRDYCQVMEGVVETAADQSCEQVILSAMSYTPQTKLNDVGILFKYFKALQDEALNFSVKVTQLMPEDSLEKLHHLYHMADKR